MLPVLPSGSERKEKMSNHLKDSIFSDTAVTNFENLTWNGNLSSAVKVILYKKVHTGSWQ